MEPSIYSYFLELQKYGKFLLFQVLVSFAILSYYYLEFRWLLFSSCKVGMLGRPDEMNSILVTSVGEFFWCQIWVYFLPCVLVFSALIIISIFLFIQPGLYKIECWWARVWLSLSLALLLSFPSFISKIFNTWLFPLIVASNQSLFFLDLRGLAVLEIYKVGILSLIFFLFWMVSVVLVLRRVVFVPSLIFFFRAVLNFLIIVLLLVFIPADPFLHGCIYFGLCFCTELCIGFFLGIKVCFFSNLERVA